MADKFITEDKIKTNISAFSLLQRMWPYCRKHLVMFWTVVFSILGVAIASRLQPTIIGYAIDHGIKENNLSLVKRMAIIYMIVQITYTLLQFIYNYLFQIFGNRVLYYIREDLLKHVQSLPIQYFDRTPVGRIVTRLTNDVSTLSEVFTEGVVTIFVQFVILSAIIISMAIISWQLAAIVLFSVPLFVWASLKINNRIRISYRDAKKKLAELNSYVSENLSGIKIVQLYNRVPKNRKKFHGFSNEYMELTLASIRSYALLQPVMNLFSATTVSLSLYYGGYFHQQNGLAIGSLVAFILHVQDFISPLREILEKYQQFQNSLTSGERVFQILDEPSENYASPLKSTTSVSENQIEIKNLNFKYQDHLPLVLQNISLKIKKGSSLAIIGRTGSGKSTLISLLQKFYPCAAQSIFIQGKAIEEYSLKELRQTLGVVQQDNFIFRGSIASNIRLSRNEISDQEIQKICDLIGYSEILSTTGRNILSRVEERGANLSVGERQLIAFARILAFQPEILILDEATANIDSKSEQLIQKAIETVSKNRTTIIIAHRLSTIEKCEKILHLQNGRILEYGSVQQLMEAKGAYYQVASAGVKSMDILSDADPGTADP